MNTCCLMLRFAITYSNCKFNLKDVHVDYLEGENFNAYLVEII